MDKTIKFYSNWLNNRKEQLLDNLGEGFNIDDVNKEIKYQVNNMKTAKVNFDQKQNAYYDPDTNEIHTSDIKLIPHEYIHAANDYKLRFSPQINKIKSIIKDNWPNYYRSPNEIYPRLMHIRQNYNLDPTKKLDIQDIQKLREKVTTPEAKELFNNINDDEAIQLFNDVAYNPNKNNHNKINYI